MDLVVRRNPLVNKTYFPRRQNRKFYSEVTCGSSKKYFDCYGDFFTALFSDYYVFAERIAVDPSTRNVYFTGLYIVEGIPGQSFIALLGQNNEFVPIITGLTSPRDIVLHPAKG